MTVPTTEGRTEQKAAYWDEFYRRQQPTLRRVPSQFATFVAGELDSRHCVVEFGCGNGRDALFFAEHGHDVIGIDGSPRAIAHCQAAAEAVGTPAVFVEGSVSDPDLPSRLPNRRAPSIVYARFFLHAITSAEEQAFLACAAGVTRPGDLMAVEYRTVRDQGQVKVTDAHFRRFLSPHQFHLDAAEYGFHVTYSVEGFGYAKYREEDAYVARALLRRG
jgi:SAM-dependent methyltransferase